MIRLDDRDFFSLIFWRENGWSSSLADYFAGTLGRSMY